MRANSKRPSGERGNAVIEAALLAPWIFFLFLGIFDTGFYCYSAICTQNAARAVALAAAQPSTPATPQSCTVALNELNMLPNVNGGNCTSLPVQVSVNTLTGSACPDAGAGSAASNLAVPYCVRSVVTYQTIPLLPIPGLQRGQITLTRTAILRIIQ